jgi:hypothetical protein
VIAGVADTHTALWYLLKNPRLSAAARSFEDDAASLGHDIVLQAISLAETVETTRQAPRVDIPEMPDRIVAAIALYFGVPVISFPIHG